MGVAFHNLTVRRLDWPSPATPGWQVYDGQVSVDTTAQILSLAMREGHPDE